MSEVKVSNFAKSNGLVDVKLSYYEGKVVLVEFDKYRWFDFSVPMGVDIGYPEVTELPPKEIVSLVNDGGLQSSGIVTSFTENDLNHPEARETILREINEFPEN